MKIKSMTALSPICLLAFVGSARADLEPYSFGASETIAHQSNLGHSIDSKRESDWLSTTEFRTALDQALGRDHVVASLAVDLNRYKRLHDRNATGYQAAAEFDWNTIGDLSGAFGADSHRRQYVYGDTTDAAIPTAGPSESLARNLQTDNHIFARVAVGGESRWTLFAGVDANRRNYTADTFRSNEEQQWSTNAGSRYSVSPDLSFGVTGTYTRGEYPHYVLADTYGIVTEGVSNFQVKSLSATSKWQASGNSAIDASIGYTTEDNKTLSSNQHFINGSLNWTWTPPSHFTIVLGLKRSSDADAATGVNTGIVNANNLNGASVNNIAMLDVSYALTAKISLDANLNYTQRKYSGVKVPEVNGIAVSDVNGSTRTSRFYLTMHYQPTRTTDLSCGGGRETSHADASIQNTLRGYNDNYLQCTASIRFD